MGKIIWLASYPKSGNTWLRIFLANYLRDGLEPVDINKLESPPIASSRIWFDELTGVQATALDNASIKRLRPGVYRCLARDAQETLFVKVHDAWGFASHNESLFPADVTAGVVYIIRNPLDLAISCAHHWGISLIKAVENLCNPDFAIGGTTGGVSEQLSQNLGSWSGHIRSWLDESNLPVYLVRFEDLHIDTEGVFSKIVNFCNLPFERARLGKAVAFSGFAELQRQEREKGFCECLTSSRPFFRRGTVGTWREELPSELVQKIETIHGQFMRRFGYLDEGNQST
ncbi:MAG: sulfotransferase domain-containing protein [Candidatus Riflebacteria bacterium]|nr:sulfotransferase domain-containing protein [Candidatus Riflebacteria bacterium]